MDTYQEIAMLELDVAGMTCGHCARAVTEAVKALDPEAQVQVDLGGKRVRVQGQSSADELIGALGAAGYPALAVQKTASAPATQKRRS